MTEMLFILTAMFVAYVIYVFVSEQKTSNSQDRVEMTGLRPSSLPHHRTCGFPHPAVGTNGFHRSGFYSLSTHPTLEPLMLGLPSMALASTHIHQAFPITTSQEAAAVAAPFCFR
jgi:hypothetical protein